MINPLDMLYLLDTIDFSDPIFIEELIKSIDIQQAQAKDRDDRMRMPLNDNTVYTL